MDSKKKLRAGLNLLAALYFIAFTTYNSFPWGHDLAGEDLYGRAGSYLLLDNSQIDSSNIAVQKIEPCTGRLIQVAPCLLCLICTRSYPVPVGSPSGEFLQADRLGRPGDPADIIPQNFPPLNLRRAPPALNA